MVSDRRRRALRPTGRVVATPEVAAKGGPADQRARGGLCRARSSDGERKMKRGGPLRRKTALKRGGPLARSPMRKKYSRVGTLATLAAPIAKALGIETTAERKTRRKGARYLLQFAGPFDGYDHGAYVRAGGCLLAQLGWSGGHRCEGPVQAAHIKPRSRGGTWRDLVGLCLLAHHEFDIQMSNSATLFQARHGVDLALEAEETARGAERRAESSPGLGRWDTEIAKRMRRAAR